MPGLIMSCNSITPNTFSFWLTTSGVPPSEEISLTLSWVSVGKLLPAFVTRFLIESKAPLRIFIPSMSIPLLLVSAVNAMNFTLSLCSTGFLILFVAASSMIDFPSGVSSAIEDKTQASINTASSTFFSGQNEVAFLLPMVMVPVLSNNNVSRSPAVSTALPLLVITFALNALSIPAMPMALSKPPMVVGIRHTYKDTNAAMVIGVFA